MVLDMLGGGASDMSAVLDMQTGVALKKTMGGWGALEIKAVGSQEFYTNDFQIQQHAFPTEQGYIDDNGK